MDEWQIIRNQEGICLYMGESVRNLLQNSIEAGRMNFEYFFKHEMLFFVINKYNYIFKIVILGIPKTKTHRTQIYAK